jgi:hypothetical protein
MQATKKKAVLAWISGAGSVLDMSGDAAPFESLSERRSRTGKSDWEKIRGDFMAVGSDLETAYLRYFDTLPIEHKREVVKRLLMQSSVSTPSTHLKEASASAGEPQVA